MKSMDPTRMPVSPPVTRHASAPWVTAAATILPPLTKAWGGLFTEGLDQQRDGNSPTAVFQEGLRKVSLQGPQSGQSSAPPHPHTKVTSSFVSVSMSL